MDYSSYGYADIPGERTAEIEWLRANPHRLHLGRIGFALTRADGSRAAPADLTDIHQTLDLWNGVITSHFRFDGEPVDVETVGHPALGRLGQALIAADYLEPGRKARARWRAALRARAPAAFDAVVRAVVRSKLERGLEGGHPLGSELVELWNGLLRDEEARQGHG